MLIIPEYLFEIKTAKFGRLRVRHLTSGTSSEIKKKVPDYNERPKRELTVASASVLCINDENNQIDGSQLSEAELTEFAEKYLGKNPRVEIIDDNLIDESPREEKENAIDHCGHAIADEINSFHNPMSRFGERPVVIGAIKEIDMLAEKVKQSDNLSKYHGLASAADNMRFAMKDIGYLSMIESPLVKAMRKTETQRDIARKFLDESGVSSAASKLAREGLEGLKIDSTAMSIYREIEEQRKYECNARGDSGIASIGFRTSFEPVKVPMPLPSPIHKTNEKLDDLTERVAASVSALKDVAEQIEVSSKSTAKQNKIMIGLTVISTLAAIISTIGYVAEKSANGRNLSVPALAAPTSAKQQLVPEAKGPSGVKSSQPHSAKKPK